MNVSIKNNHNVTPMMEQYLAVKAAYTDCLLFYRMGDFYELFFDDAIIAAKILNISLTKRGKHLGNDIAMCGVPHHSSENYLHNLIKSGNKIAICEQMETPAEAKKRGYKAVVRREVVRIITPGTITEEALLQSHQPNYIAVINLYNKEMAITWLDISTGEFLFSNSNMNNIISDLERIKPKEILVNDDLFNLNGSEKLFDNYKQIITKYPSNIFGYNRSCNQIKNFFEIDNRALFDELTKAEIGGIGCLLDYLSVTQKDAKPFIAFPKRYSTQYYMNIDPATRKNLEITESLSGNKKHCLFNAINKTSTANGARMLHRYLNSPLSEAGTINNRLAMTDFFYTHADLNNYIREILKKIPDIERAIAKISTNRGGPRDMFSIANGLQEILGLSETLEFFEAEFIPKNLIILKNNLKPDMDLIGKILKALKSDNLPILARDGGFINETYHVKIKELSEIQFNSSHAIMQLRDKYREMTNIQSLKINKNNIIGYYIEVPSGQANKICIEQFVHRQTMVSAVRFTTEELQDLEQKIISASDNLLNLELEIFNELTINIMEHAPHIALTCNAVAELDVVSNFAFVAHENNYVKPIIDNSYIFNISKGRHPVVELSNKNKLANSTTEFIANDCDLSDNQKLLLITGPNMAGKSTYLRQNALIAIMAQIGCYVPAENAHIGVIDQLYSRIGASDELANGRSTFMVEMSETAAILNQATNRSFVILDEIGRGTATYDGMAIAWAVLEYLHNNIKNRCLYATHYHELTDLDEKLTNVTNYTADVEEWEDKVIFLHNIVPGKAKKSYGIHVAKLAGLPKNVIDRSYNILEKLTNDNIIKQQNVTDIVNSIDIANIANNVDQESHSQNINIAPSATSIVEEKLSEINIDTLSPKEALDLLYELKEMI
ncbi:MAG: DNA mismatch repair protein MutS, partial [Pseudomonadota bacterium]